jgi:hypothetical protein
LDATFICCRCFFQPADLCDALPVTGRASSGILGTNYLSDFLDDSAERMSVKQLAHFLRRDAKRVAARQQVEVAA